MKADKVAKADPELAKQVAHGEISLHKAIKNIPANLPESNQGDTRDELSELSGISARNISKVKNIISTGSDELIETVRAGDISINVAENIATLPQEEQREIKGGHA
ncbi:MAG: hypothetical protein IPJ05_07845 [Nitrosomonas sp.]|nr:hypothetical protein [Nitrosomonas sp.]